MSDKKTDIFLRHQICLLHSAYLYGTLSVVGPTCTWPDFLFNSLAFIKHSSAGSLRRWIYADWDFISCLSTNLTSKLILGISMRARAVESLVYLVSREILVPLLEF